MFAKLPLACRREQFSDVLGYLEGLQQMSTYRGEDRYLWKCVKTEIGPSFFSPQVLGGHLVLRLCKGAAVLVISKCAYSPTGCHSILGHQKVF